MCVDLQAFQYEMNLHGIEYITSRGYIYTVQYIIFGMNIHLSYPDINEIKH